MADRTVEGRFIAFELADVFIIEIPSGSPKRGFHRVRAVATVRPASVLAVYRAVFGIGEKLGFEERDTLETPKVGDDAVCESGFDGALRLEVSEDVTAERIIG